MSRNLIFDTDLIRRYDKAGPRYTSYPTAAQFHSGFQEADYRRTVAVSQKNQVPAPLSLYVHLPFCSTVCHYCACNKIITKNRSKAAVYLENLYHEMQMQAALFNPHRKVEQLHWGGGTPTFLDNNQIQTLMSMLRHYFNLHQDDSGDYCIEIDPRTINEETLANLRAASFNRISLGVQDFDPKVQHAVNRIQSEEQTNTIVSAARGFGFRSLNIDLIYGLPLQTVASFDSTLDKIIAIAPDRLSVFNYAHLPEFFKTQRQISSEQLPSAKEKLAIMQHAIDKLTSAGYIYIGMDHFALPEDALVKAQNNGSLHRNFQGYSTHSSCDLIGLGVSAISRIGNTYSQNVKDTVNYYHNCANNQLSICKGIELSIDDCLRRDVIMQLICHFSLDIRALEQYYGIEFHHYFSRELRNLESMQADGLLQLSADRIQVQPVGRLLIRNICMCFDAYLKQSIHPAPFSKVI